MGNIKGWRSSNSRCSYFMLFKVNIKHFGFLIFYRTRGSSWLPAMLQLIPWPFAVMSLVLSVTTHTLLQFVFIMGISIALPQKVQAKQCIFQQCAYFYKPNWTYYIYHSTHYIQMSFSFMYLCKNTYITYCCLILMMNRFYLDLGKLWFCCTQGKSHHGSVVWDDLDCENMSKVIDQFEPILIIRSTSGVSKVVSAVSRLIEKYQ